MQTNRDPFRLSYSGRPGTGGPGLLTKILAALVGAAVLIGAVAVSLVLFAIAAVGIVIFGGYLWWKTRTLRRQMREMASQASDDWSNEWSASPPPGTVHRDPFSGGTIIEGEVIREPDERTDRPRH